VRLLLDECIDRRLTRELIGHDARTATQMGWATFKNGALLSIAEKEFDVFITVDRNLSFQQNLTKVNLAIIVLHAKTNKLEDLRPLVPALLAAVPKIQPKQTITISI